MSGIGTLINVIAIIAGGVIGLTMGNRLSEKCRTGLICACGVCTFFLGVFGSVEQVIQIQDNKLVSHGAMIIVISFAIGTLLGSWWDLEGKIEKFGTFLKAKAKASDDMGFVNAFVVTSLTVCIGAMAVVGAIQDGINSDYSVLAAKSVLDFVIVMILAASLGRGAVFSAIPVGIFQGTITVLAVLIEPLMTPLALSYLSMTGSMLISCVGINLIWGPKTPVANMLPTLLVAIAFAFFPFSL